MCYVLCVMCYVLCARCQGHTSLEPNPPNQPPLTLGAREKQMLRSAHLTMSKTMATSSNSVASAKVGDGGGIRSGSVVHDKARWLWFSD